LEAAAEFPYRVRGESMQAWGDIPMNLVVPDIAGSLNPRHPDACQSLLDAAAAVGAAVVRGVSDVRVAAGSSPSVHYAVDGVSAELRTSLVVGADGRRSVTLRALGIRLQRLPETSYIAGLLLDGLGGVPDDHDVLIGEDDRFFLLFHQGDGRARAYACTGLSGQHRFAGPDGAVRFLEACAVSSYPWSEPVVAAIPAGPCATHPGDDTWCAEPYVDGAVLIGDAAGHNDYERTANMDAAVFPLIHGIFAGPETIGDEMLDPGLLENIRAA
jgi:2-polyprenyl-6-methoxyphenol hydroxylase-like FAD-dependent oxidoreductase